MTVNIQDIIDYEDGELDDEQVIDMFQKLINSGQAWSLQGHYGRMAKALIDDGHCTYPDDSDEKGGSDDS